LRRKPKKHHCSVLGIFCFLLLSHWVPALLCVHIYKFWDLNFITLFVFVSNNFNFIFLVLMASLDATEKTTVKLDYNDHGYNELTVITNKLNLLVWFSIFSQWNFMLITNNFLKIHGYNEQKLYCLVENVMKFHKYAALINFNWLSVWKP